MADSASAGWNEKDSVTFLETGDIFVPDRPGQIALLLDLLPAQPDETFTIVELAAGGGALAEAILTRYPRCRYIALDGSETMRRHLTQRLASFADRVTISPFELTDLTWRRNLPVVRCVVSSLAIHHLSEEDKRELFIDMANHIEPGGALLVADIVRPANRAIANLVAREYDDIVRQQSLAHYGDLRAYQSFQKQKWNYFAYDYDNPASGDIPSSLSSQLLWMIEAFLSPVDCFWLRAGHAIYGGYKPRA